jgi:leader peptidase (prepilin peptidase)/N-methyltransferase
MRDWIQIGTVLVFLAICMIEDLRSRTVSLNIILVFLACGIVFRLYYDGLILNILGGSAIGFTFMLFSAFKKKFLGVGDGLILLTTGVYIGFFENLKLLFYASLLGVIIGGVMILAKKWTGQTKIPFAPFLFCGYVVVALQ